MNKTILNEAEFATLQPGPTHALLAAIDSTIFLEGTVPLNPIIQDAVYPDKFQVSSELRAELVLGRPWLRRHQVKHDHVADCIFVSSTGRQRVYLSPLPNAYKLAAPKGEVDVQSDFPPELKHQFTNLIRLHALSLPRRRAFETDSRQCTA